MKQKNKEEKNIKFAGQGPRSRVVPPSFNEPENVRQPRIDFSKYQNLIRKKVQDDEQQALVT